MSRIGERLSLESPRYIKHPPGGVGWMSDGYSMDAGSAHILDNNLSHLSHESVHHIGTCSYFGELEPGQNGTWTETLTGYDATYKDVVLIEPDDKFLSDVKAVELVAWDHRSSVRLGPRVAIQDRELDGGGQGIRQIYVEVQVERQTGASLYLVAAVTSSPAAPNKGAIAAATIRGTINSVAPDDAAADVTQIFRLELSVEDELVPSIAWSSRVMGSQGNTVVSVAEYYVWIGFVQVTLDTVARILGVSAYEIR